MAATSDDIRKLEGKLIPTYDWESAPENVRKLAEERFNAGAQTGIAYDAQWGWCVIQSTGDGPVLIYHQKSPDAPI